ncbi:RICIN domain-containing protein [Secundilactobacillus similis]|nr:RICIN domain-containing protein [Secundilactobacillus similis]
MIKIDEETYLLKDLYTQKSFAPVGEPVAGTQLAQRPIGGDKHQHWQFNRQDDGTYTIQLAGSDLYITSTSSTVDDRLVLQPASDDTDQRWTLTQQHPII